MRSAALSRRAREARSWLMDACFPLWSETGYDGTVFLEVLDLQHRRHDTPFSRVRVQARQTYVFAVAARMGWSPKRAQDLMSAGINILSTQARRADGLIGRTIKTDGSGLLDETPDLYDTAFTLLALAQAALSINQPAHPLKLAREIVTNLDTYMKDHKRGGYAEWLPAPDRRLQNPHMHMFEACLALHKADPSGGYLKRAGEFLSLFQTRLTAGTPRIVAENFMVNWNPETGAAHDHVEPGHQFEWAWLLTRHARLIDAFPPPEAQTLYDFAISTCDAEGHLPQLTDRSGVAVDPSRRVWPQTEALKAYLMMAEIHSQAIDADRAIRSFDILMDEYLTPEGGWVDHYDGGGSILSATMPASTGYHVVLAFTELLRLSGA